MLKNILIVVLAFTLAACNPIPHFATQRYLGPLWNETFGRVRFFSRNPT